MQGTKWLYSGNIGERGEVVKHKCRFIAQGFRQIKGIRYKESSSPTPAVASIRMALTATVGMDMELCHIDFKQAYLLADVDIGIYIEPSEEYRQFPDAAVKFNNAIYGLVQAGRC